MELDVRRINGLMAEMGETPDGALTFLTDPPQKKVKKVKVRIIRETDYQHLLSLARISQPNAPKVDER